MPFTLKESNSVNDAGHRDTMCNLRTCLKHLAEFVHILSLEE